VTDVGLVDDATGQRSFLQRQFGSKVAVRSGETLVLGGLIRDNTASGKSGLPGLQDIPLFGALFGANTKTVNRTELLVVITPRVVRTEQDVRQLGQELKDRMKTLYPPLNPTPRDDVQEKSASPPDR
jgi:general secretion pathway protein D